MLPNLASRALVLATLLLAMPALLRAQHSHDHSDTTASSHGQQMAGMDMHSSNGDWRTEAMARHMAYSGSRPLTPQDSVRAAHVVNELRQAIAKYQDVKVAEADGYKMFAP